MKLYEAVHPVMGEELSALPVKAIGPAVAFCRSVLGFSVVESGGTKAVVQRDGVRLGLVREPGHRPEEAGSLAFVVTGLGTMRAGLDGHGLDLSAVRTEERAGSRCRVFFLRETEDGCCFCFSQRVESAS